MNKRSKQLGLAAIMIVVSWYGMMGVHEAGHCLGGLMTGGRIERVEFPLIGFSRTDVSGSRNPLLVTWAGPVAGTGVPLALLAIVPWAGRSLKQCLLFFVGFCLIANGIYIGTGGFMAGGDGADLLARGARLWQLVVFGVAALLGGLVVWHRLGRVTKWFVT